MTTLTTQYTPTWQISMPDSFKKPIVYHSLFWAVYFALNVIRWGAYFDDYWYSLKSNFLGFSIHILLCYLSAYYLVPRFVAKKQFLTYFILLLGAIGIMSFVKITLHYYVVDEVIWRESLKPQNELFGLNHVFTVMLGELYVVGLTTAIKLGKDWIQEQRRSQELEKKNLETELDFLKSQIQPHFFFNTLNNLYSLTLIKSDLAPEIVLKLSELMSYVLYDARSTKVSLIKEIGYLQHYLDLERLRFGNRLEINFDIEGDIEGRQIPPLILLTFLENIFKHGVNHQAGNIEINIFLKIENNILTFQTENPIAKNMSIVQAEKSGIGLKNIRRRLDLLFSQNYSLQIGQENEIFKVKLVMPT